MTCFIRGYVVVCTEGTGRLLIVLVFWLSAVSCGQKVEGSKDE